MISKDPFSLVNDSQPDVRVQLLQLGLTQHAATLAIPYTWFLPSTSDPYAQAVIGMVEAIQRTLRDKGYPVRVTGYVDTMTHNALRQAVGGEWTNRPWVAVIGRVLVAPRARGASLTKGTAMYGFGDDIEMSFEPTEASYTVSGGTCTPTTVGVRARYRALQEQINRAARGVGTKTIAVDGVLGANTLAAAKEVAKKAPIEVGVVLAYADCQGLAKMVDNWITAFKAVGDRRKVPATSTSQAPLDVLTAGPGGSASPMVLIALGLGAFYLYRRGAA